MSLVLDGSVTLSWCFEDEGADVAHAVLGRVTLAGAVVPPIWHFEVANGLQIAVRRKRIDAVYRDDTLVDLAGLDIVTDDVCAANAWTASVALADRHRLTIYDASYLELAQRRRVELATLDAALARTAHAEAVPVVWNA